MFLFLRALSPVSFYEHCLCVCRGYFRMCHSGVKPRNDKGGSVFFILRALSPVSFYEHCLCIGRGHFRMCHSGVKPRNDKGGSVFFILRALSPVSFYEHCLCVCRGHFRMCHSGVKPRNPGHGAYKDVPAGQWPPVCDGRRQMGNSHFLAIKNGAWPRFFIEYRH